MPEFNEPKVHAHGGDTPDWGHAFAALPLEAPDASAWPRLQRALAPRRRARWPAWSALAAVLALAAVVPWQLARVETGNAAGADTAARIVAPQAGDRPARTARDVERVPAAPTTRVDDIASTSRTSPAADALPAAARPMQRANTATTVRSDALSNAATRLAAAEQPLQEEAATPAAATGQATDPQLEPLYAESAQLEALLALARDDRVATGTAAALTSAYDAQVASIDQALREPALPGDQRAALWQQRVDALRQLAGFESTQRVLAAHGERYDAMLVSID